MESYEDVYNSICRLCLSYGNSDNMVSLTDNTTKDGLSCYGEAVRIFTNICIKKDSLPDKMCVKCLFILKQAIIFRKRCESSDKKLKLFVRKFDASNTDFKEKLCDYVMFMSSFSRTVEYRGSNSMKSVESAPENVSQTPSLKKASKEIKPTLKKLIKTEIPPENYEDDDFVDFEDSTSNGIKEETKSEPKIKENIDELLANMDKVAELSSTYLKKYKKRYPINKKQNSPKKKKRILFSHKTGSKSEQKEKQKEDLKCKVCSKILSSVPSLKHHMERHTGGSYICEHCGRKFCSKAELQYHLASTHEIGKQYTCKECGFKAPKKYELMEHERIHTGERPYTCDKCGLTFRRRGVWRKHSLYHKEKTIQCQQCPRKFYVKGELIAHVNGVHQRMYIFACNYCDTTYAKTGTVRRHMIDKHGIAREEQGKIKRINIAKTSNVWSSAGRTERSRLIKTTE